MKQPITFTITIDSQEIVVHYEPDFIPRYLARIEFVSPHTPRRQILVSETGYLNHFVYLEELKDVSDITEYAYKLVHALIAEKSNVDIDDEEDTQLLLF
jgi:hypothetical protein